MKGTIKAIGLLILVYFLAAALNFINVNHVAVPSLPGTQHTAVQVGDK